MNLYSRTLSTFLFSAALAATALPANQAEASSKPDITVERLEFPVTLSDGNTYNVVGHLYYNKHYAYRPLQVLVHGLTYTSQYWDIPSFGGQDYSYARYMAKEGYAVLALDMLGAGESDRPDGDFLNLAETAESVHQIIGDLRTHGGVVKRPFSKIALVGHSNGAIISTYVQSTYNDADVLVNTGLAFTPHPIPVTPEAISALLQTPYIAIPTEIRTEIFYDAANADPALIAFDNAQIASTYSRGQFLDLLAVSSDPSLSGIGGVTSPVLIQFGETDELQPAAYVDSDAALYTSAKSRTTAIVPDAGHILNGHFGAPIGWEQIDCWIHHNMGW
ncbi:carboxylesterase [Sorangium cellulosum]|uniref:Carboxylesterase n=1 Tax=Sorangium cellulosum TaxID=56 RepID=A0A2L0ENX2_SORCE|nr:alpha/beta fold hydrolase [Sorangium cellulosum]AUX40952.1 carboxylesterase [Sorangium cellulosum]